MFMCSEYYEVSYHIYVCLSPDQTNISVSDFQLFPRGAPSVVCAFFARLAFVLLAVYDYRTPKKY